MESTVEISFTDGRTVGTGGKLSNVADQLLEADREAPDFLVLPFPGGVISARLDEVTKLEEQPSGLSWRPS